MLVAIMTTTQIALITGASRGLGLEVARLYARRGIRTVHSGGSYLEPRVASKLLAEVTSPRIRGSGLSEREREVLRLVAEGLPTKQIARSLSISERTVKFHVNSIFHKLGADNRAQAVALAAQRGLL